MKSDPEITCRRQSRIPSLSAFDKAGREEGSCVRIILYSLAVMGAYLSKGAN